MAYVHSKRGLGFKMEFPCLTFLMGDGKTRRAAVVGYAPMPNDPNHMRCVVLFEGMDQPTPKVVRRADLDKALRDKDHISLTEAPQSQGAAVLVGPDGTVLTRN